MNTDLDQANLIDITRLSHDGRGVGRDANGKAIFIDGVLPGERVTYTIKSKKRRFTEAQVLEIISPAPERAVPECAHFLTCGGCAQQHISHAVQLTAKQQSLLEQLEHFGQVKPINVLEPLTGPQWSYRTKARLGVRYVIKKEKVLVGFREKNSNYLADIDSCKVLHPKIGLMIDTLKIFIATLKCYDTIAQLEIAIGDDHLAMIVRHMQALTNEDHDKLVNFAQQQEFDLYLQPGNTESVHKVWPKDDNPRLYYTLPAYNLSLAFHPNDFTQVNPYINQKMIKQAIELLQINSEDYIFDLFCGLGNFTLPMAQIAKQVTGIEGSAAMVERGYENAKRNNINNVNFYAADLTKDQSAQVWARQKYTKVLLDPPRTGAAEVLPLVAGLGVNMILYVSCNPATLARDSGILTSEYGYKMQYVGIMDMFPHTLHVEAMALFTR